MTIDRNTRVPDSIVFSVMYAVVFGISIWLLGFRNDSPTNWILYIAMGVAVVAGLLKLGFDSLKKYQRPTLAKGMEGRDFGS
jgi:hypothetical protein